MIYFVTELRLVHVYAFRTFIRLHKCQELSASTGMVRLRIPVIPKIANISQVIVKYHRYRTPFKIYCEA